MWKFLIMLLCIWKEFFRFEMNLKELIKIFIDLDGLLHCLLWLSYLRNLSDFRKTWQVFVGKGVVLCIWKEFFRFEVNDSLTIFVELAFGIFPIPKGWNDYSKAVRFRTKSRRDDIIIKRLKRIMPSLRDLFHRCVFIL